MKFLFLLYLSLSSAWASFPELFGPSAGSMAIGHQPEEESAANNIYAPALLGFVRETQFSFNYFYVNTEFYPIKEVVIKNETNTVNDFETGNIDTNSTPSGIFSAHLSTPLFRDKGPKLNLSIIAPADRILEADTGDPYQPSYIMYSNRFLRPSIHFSLSQVYNDWSFSLGAITGVQSNGETYAVTKTTSDSPSVAKVSFNAKPSLGATASIAKRFDQHTLFFAFQQEMKSNFQSRATGETEIASNGSLPFDFDIHSLIFYDPMTIRLGHQLIQPQTTWHLSLEYQHWENFEPATLGLKKRGGTINGSNNFEKLNPKNILIPKIGNSYKFAETWKAKLGYFYRPSVLAIADLSQSGNSIDTSKHVASAGVSKLFILLGNDVHLDLSYQIHLLNSAKVNKETGQENGVGNDPKIGSPGYRIGGTIHIVALGMSWKY